MTDKARILFVDDEKRVLNSMRGLFRREYELFLTTEGSEAIKIARENSIDVIVADQRMPGMTGIEVLGKVKELSPRTIRILLTGYADPEAVEGSINIGEVFRFLSKPCPPNLLRETLGIAISASRTRPATPEQQVAPADAAQSADRKGEARAAPVNGVQPAPEEAQRNADLQKTAESAPRDAPQQAASSSTGDAAPGRTEQQAPGEKTAQHPEAAADVQRPKPTPAPATTQPAAASSREARDAEHPVHESATSDMRTPGSHSAEAAETGSAETSTHNPRTAHIESPVTPTTSTPSPQERPPQEVPLAAAAPSASIEIADNEDTEPALPVLDLSSYEPQLEQTSSHWHSVTNVILSEDTIEETQENIALKSASLNVKDVGVVVFTVDSTFAEMAIRALSADRNTILATTLVKVAHALEEHSAGVLVTDFTTNSAVLQKMIGALKQYMPELVTIVVSSGRDTTDMINLINYGQVFRYVLKPIDPRHLRNDVNAAAIRYLYLLSNPDAVKRHQVIEAPAPTDTSSSLNRFFKRIRVLQNQRVDPTDTIS